MSRKQLYLDNTTKDLVVENFQLKFTTNNPEFVSQKIEQKLLFFQGEWYLNVDLGLPYFTDILVKNPDINLIRNLFLTEITDIPEVLEVLQFDLDYDNAIRELTLTFKVRTDDGSIQQGTILL